MGKIDFAAAFNKGSGMTACLEKSCLFDVLGVSVVKFYQFVCVLLSVLVLMVACGF